MKKTFLILFAISYFLLTPILGSFSANELTDQNGRITHTLSCSGTGKDWNDCYLEADTLCPNGYTIIEKSTGIVSAPINGQYTIVPSKKIIIECK